jgi:hypothetical protein
MNSKTTILPAIVVTILIIIGIIFFLPKGVQTNTSGEHTMEGMNHNPVAQSHRGYDVEVTSDTSNVLPGKSTTITYQIKNDKGEIVKNYDVVHEKNMHFIAVRKDLTNFQHLHPTFDETSGEFSIDVTFPENGLYRIFPDFTPSDENPQKLPVTVSEDISVGDAQSYTAMDISPDTVQTKSYGSYEVNTTFSAQAKKQQEITYTLNIKNNGQPVTNLETYLGALGHSVILKEGSLDFIHTHAIEGGAEHGEYSSSQTSTSTGPEVSFATNFPESGLYRIYTQFQHKGKVQTVEYTVDVQ